MAELNLTDIYSRVNDIKRNLFYGDGSVLKFMRGTTELLILEDSFYLDKNPTSVITERILNGPKGFSEFFECSIADLDDDIDLETIIKASTNIEISDSTNSEKFAIGQYFRPRGLTKKWVLRLISEGKK